MSEVEEQEGKQVSADEASNEFKETIKDSVKYLDDIIHEDSNSEGAVHHKKIFDMMKRNEEKFGKIKHPVPYGKQKEEVKEDK